MAFNGTESFERQEIVTYLESIGMRFGPDLNAYTGFDETVYMLHLPSDDPEILASGLHILEEWAHRVTFDPAEIEDERGVVLEEWRAGRGAGARISDRQIPLLFAGSLYADRLPIGDTAVIRSAPPERLRDFYRRWYRPERMTLIAVGDFDADRLEEEIRTRFGGWRVTGDPEPRPEIPVPLGEGPAASILTDPELPYTQVTVAWRLPPAPEGTIEGYREHLVTLLHDAMLGARLHERTLEAEPPFLAAGAGRASLVRGADLYLLQGVVEEGESASGLEALLEESGRIRQHGFTASELERQKLNLLRSMQRAFADEGSRTSASRAEELVRHALTGESVPGIEAELALVEELLPSIDLVEIDGAVTEHLREENRVLLVSAPEGEAATLPSTEEFDALFREVEARVLPQYEDRVVEGELLADSPIPGTIVSEERLDSLEALRWVLSNGATVLVKQTDFRDDEVRIQGWAPGGISRAPDDALVPALTASAVVGQGGLGEHSVPALERLLAGTAVQAGVTIGTHAQSVGGSGSPVDLESLFQLLHLHVTAPRLDPAASEAFRTQLRTALANRGSTPAVHLLDTITVTMASGHPRSRPPGPWYLEAFDPEASLDFQRTLFADASSFIWVIVGAVEPETVRPLVERYIASLPRIEENPGWIDRGIRTPDGFIRKTIRRGIEPQARTQLLFTGEHDLAGPAADPFLALARILDLRLRDTLRERLGGTYGVQVVPQIARQPVPNHTLSIAFGSAPERVDELLDALTVEIENLRRDGPREAELRTVTEADRREREIALRDNLYWMEGLRAWERGETSTERFLSSSRFDRLTSEMIREAAEMYLRFDRLAIFTLLPEGSP